ncbi:MAG: hypothetical protein PUF49_05080 [Firmicutes bacterium]|nr:hypothetical protein [Bacillota bacterium]
MKYYKVKSECGGKTAFAFHRAGGLRIVGQYIANELYTATELKRRHDCLYEQYMDIIEIPKNKTFFSFGARFEMKEDK